MTTTISPFAQVGQLLYDRGFSPIPITPGDKKPGIMIGDEWRLFKGWNEHCITRPSAFQVKQWSKYPNAGVGVACGMGLICIDIDQENLIDPLLAILPPSLVQKKGRKGISLFYRGNTEVIRSKNYRTPERIGLVDLLAEGKQTVLPPSIHPDTGEPYYWWSDLGLQDVTLDELEELPEDIADRIAEVLKGFGFDPDFDRREVPPSSTVDGEPVENSGDFFRKLNEDALANIAAWAPLLGLPKGRWHGRVYRAVAPWRSSGSGRPLLKRMANLSIAPGGIEDFGTGDNFTALNVVMKAKDIPELERDAAVQWLGERLGYDFGVTIDLVNGPKTIARLAAKDLRERVTPLPEKIIYESTPTHQTPSVINESLTTDVRKWEPPVQRSAPAMVNDSPAAEPADAVEESEVYEEPDAPDPTMDDLEALCAGVPGLVGKIIEWITETNKRPSRPAAIGAALTFVGTLAGRWHAGPTNLRTNLYYVTLAPSAYGKNHPREQILALAQAAGLDRFIGPEGYLSDSALRKTVERDPSILSLMDEFGGFVAKIMDRRAGTHQSGIRQMLMQFFTSSSSFYKGQAAAAEGAAIIHNPCFSIYGTSTAHDFWPSMSGKGVADGFLPRTLIVTLSGEETINYYPKDIAVPSHLIDECRTVLTDSGRGNLPDSAARPPSKVRTATWGPGGHDAYIRWETLCKQRQRKAEPGIDVLWSRCVEKALRVAHIVAIGVNTSAPVLTEELIDWACRLCELSTRQTIVEVKDRLASTDKQAEYLKVRRMIKDGGKDGVAVRALKKMVNGEFDGARFDAIIKQLTDAGDIEFREYVSPKGGRPGYRYFAV